MSKKDRFKPGQSGNPNGRPPMPKEINRFKKLTIEELEELGSVLMRSTKAEIDDILKDPAESQIRVIVAKALMLAASEGNFNMLDSILNRVIGRPKEKIDLTVTKPSILIKKDGTEVIFTNQPVTEVIK